MGPASQVHTSFEGGGWIVFVADPPPHEVSPWIPAHKENRDNIDIQFVFRTIILFMNKFSTAQRSPVVIMAFASIL